MSRLSKKTYYDLDKQLKYMGYSQVKDFMDCEARALATIKGEYIRNKTSSLLIGSYVDAYFEGTLDTFKANNPEVFTKQGDLKSEYRHAEYIINRISRDKIFMKYMSGRKQVIKTRKLNDIPFKIKIDSYHKDKCIVDLKVVKDFEPVWVKGKGKINFIMAWGYDMQAAIYRAVEGNNLPYYIAAATKEKEPDFEVFQIPQHIIDTAYELVMEKVDRYQKIKQGIIKPERCGHCDYCKMTKVLTAPISMEELDYE